MSMLTEIGKPANFESNRLKVVEVLYKRYKFPTPIRILYDIENDSGSFSMTQSST